MSAGRSVSARALALVLATAATVATPALAAPPPVQSYDTYKSWLVACDNALSCTAKGFDDAGDRRTEMTIVRAAGPAARATLTVRSDGHFARDAVTADGASLPLRPNDWTIGEDKDGTTLMSSAPDAVAALLQNVADAQALKLGDAGGTVPLAGLRAALLRMDVRQGRLGTVTALSRSGSGAANVVPAPPALPAPPRHPATAQLSPADEKRLIALTRVAAAAAFKAEDCETDTGSFVAEAHALDPAHALVLLPCLMGAYQGSALTYLAPRAGNGPITRITLPTPYLGGKPDDQVATMVTSPGYDDKTGSLTMSARGRGLADCGTSASWVWDGARFVLTDLAMQQACGGVDPGDWPVLYRTAR